MINWWKKKDGVFKKLPRDLDYTLIHTRDGGVFYAQFEVCDVEGNNTVPYCWVGPGPFYHFGKNVTHWASLNKPNP